MAAVPVAPRGDESEVRGDSGRTAVVGTFPAHSLLVLIGEMEKIVKAWRACTSVGQDVVSGVANAAITGGHFTDRHLPQLPEAMLVDLRSKARREVDKKAEELGRCLAQHTELLDALRKLGESLVALHGATQYGKPTAPEHLRMHMVGPRRATALVDELLEMFDMNHRAKEIIVRRITKVTESDVLTVFAATWTMEPYADWARVHTIFEVLKGVSR